MPDSAFVAVGAASGLGSALLGSVGPLTAPFFQAKGFTRAHRHQAACALLMHAAKLTAYGVGNLLTPRVLLLGAAMTPATVTGAWVGKKIMIKISDRMFVILVETGLVAAGLLFLTGIA
ncbi:TSUP family transporter [Micromonospora sp. NPDC047548]|uniref:TSUP family transporter n=1 Tax=Micromonospora sp. NPDC047548 TaxID=3155624 RepID=UPI0033BFC7E6